MRLQTISRQRWRLRAGGGVRIVLLSAAVPVLAGAAPIPSSEDLQALRWRFVGPVRGGRVNAVVGRPTEPTVFYAGYTGGGVWKTEDGGSHWVNVSDGQIKKGSIGAIDISRSDPNVLYVGTGEHALRGDVSHGNGVYKSTDGGETWTHVGLADTRQIARVVIHPEDSDTVYVAAIGHFTGPNRERGVFRTTDGGRSFQEIETPHDDHHDLWIDPNNNHRMIDGSDAGALITFNQGKTWSTLFNQPTAQIYTLTIDNQFPYFLYGSQQDWGSVAVSSQPRARRMPSGDEWETARSEGGYTAVDAKDPDILYVGDHHWMFELNRRTGYHRYITPRHDNYYGWGTADIEYRFFWSFPVLLSPHDPSVLYIGSQYVHKTTNGGDTWEIISPDLTTADPETMELTPHYGRDVSANGPYWGPLTRDSNGDNWYNLLYTIAESPLEQGVIWTGSDDGLIHVTRDGGKHWDNVTPGALPKRTLVSHIEPSPFDPAAAYFAATRYKLDDMGIYLYKTSDFGKSWTPITEGIEAEDFVRVVRADPVRRDLLYAGSETGVYVSVDDGAHWRRLQRNLPHVPVYDMKVKDGDLAIATHGRGFWILDDVSVLRQWASSQAEAPLHLYRPRVAVRYRHRPGLREWNPPTPYGATIYYRLRQPAKERLEIRFKEADGELIRRFVPKGEDAGRAPTNRTGLNRFVWDLRYPGAEDLEDHPTRASKDIGPFAVPGRYQVELVVDGATAAVLVDSGFTGVRDCFSGERNFLDVFSTDPSPERLVDALGSRFEVMRTNIKKYPVGSPIQAPLDALTILIQKHKLTPERVGSLLVRMPSIRTINDREMPDINLQYILAVTLLDGGLSFEAAHDYARMKDPAVAAIKKKITLKAEPELRTPETGRTGIVEVVTNDGAKLMEHVKSVLGTAQHPMKREDVERKCRGLLEPVLGEERAAGLVETVWHLEIVKDIRELRPFLASA